jgi:hypothetical protein
VTIRECGEGGRGDGHGLYAVLSWRPLGCKRCCLPHVAEGGYEAQLLLADLASIGFSRSGVFWGGGAGPGHAEGGSSNMWGVGVVEPKNLSLEPTPYTLHPSP